MTKAIYHLANEIREMCIDRGWTPEVFEEKLNLFAFYEFYFRQTLNDVRFALLEEEEKEILFDEYVYEITLSKKRRLIKRFINYLKWSER